MAIYILDASQKIDEGEIKEAKELSAEEKKICGPFLLFFIEKFDAELPEVVKNLYFSLNTHRKSGQNAQSVL